MTDLKRVMYAVLADERDTVRDIIDAHLKEDAERDRLLEAIGLRYKWQEDELARLRSENQHLISRLRAALDERDRLREELEDATEMLAWAYQWVDPHKHVAVDIAEFLRARAALKETT